MLAVRHQHRIAAVRTRGAVSFWDLVMTPDWPRAFPAVLSERVVHAARRLPPAEFQHAGLVTHSNAHHWPALVVDGETVEVPYRMYNPELPGWTWDALSALDRASWRACTHATTTAGSGKRRSAV
jgi:hypothetical protein